MYGTVARLSLRPGQEAALLAAIEQSRREGKPKGEGLLGDYVLKSERIPGDWMVMALFDNEENYRKNAADPDQHRQYEEIRALLTADPEWNDGEIITIEPV